MSEVINLVSKHTPPWKAQRQAGNGVVAIQGAAAFIELVQQIAMNP